MIGSGIHTNIGPKLAAALRRLRNDTTSRILWVDAICINQTDDLEKADQIRMLGFIYQNAYQVLVWLGLDGPALASESPIGERASFRCFSTVCAIVNTWMDTPTVRTTWSRQKCSTLPAWLQLVDNQPRWRPRGS